MVIDLRNYFEDGDDGSTFLKKVVKMAKNGHRSNDFEVSIKINLDRYG